MKKMNTLLSLTIIFALLQTGLALKCWSCTFSGNPNKACLKAGTDPAVSNKTFTIENCAGKDPACVKTQMSMSVGGAKFDLTQRMCMQGMKAMAGNCIDQEVPAGQTGQTITANMCACDSDQCNSAPFSSQISVFGMLLPVAFSVINNAF